MGSKIVDAKKHFQDWYFEIRPELFAALGVTRREYIDREKTKAKREAAKAEGFPKERLASIAVKYSAHAVENPPQYDFHEGDIFYSKDGRDGLQVGEIKDEIEVWALAENRYVGAHRVNEHEFAEWLRTGREPADSRISRNESWKELARFYILPPDPVGDEEPQKDLPLA